jgi:hypothetical protein
LILSRFAASLIERMIRDALTVDPEYWQVGTLDPVSAQKSRQNGLIDAQGAEYRVGA